MKKKYDIQLVEDIQKYNRKRKLSNYFPKGDENGVVFEYNEEFERILKARYNKCSRIKKRIVYLFYRYKYVYFITFTFDDNYINKSDRSKKNMINRALKNYDFKYILNVDYGKENEREHYHCILATNNDLDMYKFLSSNYYYTDNSGVKHYPFIWVGKVRKDIDNLQRLEKYINKLTNHAVKNNIKRERVIYNFKGFDNLSLDSHEKWLIYKKVFFDLFG